MKITRLIKLLGVVVAGLQLVSAPCFSAETASPVATPEAEAAVFAPDPEPAPAPAPFPEPTAPTLVAPSTSGPTAEVKAVHLNMRAADNSNATIVRVASQGEFFPVLEKKGDWLKVSLPTGALVFLRKDSVAIEGQEVKVTRPSPFLAAPSPSAPVMGQAEKDDTFALVQEHGTYVKIRSHKESEAWISGKHAVVHGTIPGGETALPSRTAEPVPVAAPKAEDAFSPAGMTSSRSVTWEELRSEIDRMDRQVQQQLSDAAAIPEAPASAGPLPPPSPDFLYTGYMREAEFSPVKKALPFQYRLTKGGRDICALSSTKFLLKDFIGKMVGVTGYYEDNPYSGDKILVVTGMTVLE